MIIDWIAGALVIGANILIGRGDRTGWLLNLTAQAPLMYLNYKFKLWGLFPMSIFLTVVFAYNYWRWLKNDVKTGSKAFGRIREGCNTPSVGSSGDSPTVESDARTSGYNRTRWG